MKTIDNDIKFGQLKKVYLLYGEERYLVKQYRDKLKKALADPDDTMNFSSFEGEDINVKEIIDLAETLPFFAERRVIFIENSKLFKKGGDELGEYLENLPETTYFVFVEEEIDKRSKLYKEATKQGNAVEFVTQTDETLMKWIGGRISKEGKNITQAAYRAFIAKTGTDMQNIEKELEKLICYCMDKEVIEPEDVEAITTEQISNKVFDMVDAIASHKQKQAMDLYYDLLALREAPMRILFLITRQFQTLLTVKVMTPQGFSNKDIAAKAGCPEWVVRKYQGQAKAFSLDQIKQAISDGVEYEEAVKTGHMNDQMAVELFIVQYSKGQE
ncbi:MAG: DNA polymerase III subunit delta [Lachnospiraceae bacterium]|nr:DNA polymerase III subunit delta [Lachnospiraceae bacterium]